MACFAIFLSFVFFSVPQSRRDALNQVFFRTKTLKKSFCAKVMSFFFLLFLLTLIWTQISVEEEEVELAHYPQIVPVLHWQHQRQDKDWLFQSTIPGTCGRLDLCGGCYSWNCCCCQVLVHHFWKEMKNAHFAAPNSFSNITFDSGSGD